MKELKVQYWLNDQILKLRKLVKEYQYQMIKFLIARPYKLYLFKSFYMASRTNFNPTPEKVIFPSEEERILEYWNSINAFHQQLDRTKHLKPFTFYDGPPFATGLPHYGHLAAGTIKDVVCRYATQTGHYVERRFGWDCHGLPVEYEIDKLLKIKDKRQVLEMGIDKYNAECRGIVMKYSSEWRKTINRFGRWIDFDNDYKTLNIDFMESVWYIFKQIYQKGLVYRGKKVMPYSCAVNTVLSNFEANQNYMQVNDPSVHITFPLVKDPTVKFVAWTTTPWTLPSNLALAVNPNFIYLKLKDIKRNDIYIVAECRVADLYKDPKAYEVIEKIKGSDLEGTEYEPLFDFFQSRRSDGCFRVLAGDFVTADTGTGIVHCAPGFGHDDYKLCVEKKIIKPDDPVLPMDANGKFTKQVGKYAEMYFKDADKPIKQQLKQRGRLLMESTFKHQYPFCWRSDTPLMYRAVDAWFIKVTAIKQDMIKNNSKAYWVPKQVQEGRFDSWLKNAEDWCFSRNRFWGNPIPLWVSDDGEEVVCIGSIQELKELSGATEIKDLHREFIDHLTIPSKQGKGVLRRIEEVFDCWFESGSMPYAQVHFPFSCNQEKFKTIFPADFIGEGIDQTRGWFYTLNVIATAVFNDTPYKNLIVNGLALAADGTKMSKRLGNYPPPEEVINEFGADAIRLYLVNSPLVRAENLCFKKQGVESVVKEIFLPWYNAYRFLIQNISKLEAKTDKAFVFDGHISKLYERFNLTDKWVESCLHDLIKSARKEMNEYKLYAVVPKLVKFLDNLTNWYVRLNRNRIKGELSLEEMQVSVNVLFDVLLNINILMSPQVPFLTEYMYQNMKHVINKESRLFSESIHFLMIPDSEEKLIDSQIQRVLADTQEIIETGRKLRDKKKISLKHPIMSLTIVDKSVDKLNALKPMVKYIEEELNVAEVLFEPHPEKYIKHEAKPNLPVLGAKLKGNKNFKGIQDKIKAMTFEEIEKAKENGTISFFEVPLNVKEDIIITDKFIDTNIKPHEAIDGSSVFVLLDTRQSEQLKIKGYAREIINKVQRLKKQGGVSTEDHILIFYKFDEKATYLNLAMQKELASIEHAIKKPFISDAYYTGQVLIDKDAGSVEGEHENYNIKISYVAPVLDPKQIEASYGELAQLVIKAVMGISYKKIKEESKNKQIEFRLEGKDIVLKEGTHYKLYF